MKKGLYINLWSILSLFFMCVGGFFVSPVAEAQEKNVASTEQSVIQKEKFTDIPSSFFNSSEGSLEPIAALRALGVNFPPGTSATYNKKKKTLVVLNTKENLAITAEAIRLFKENSIPYMVQVIDAGFKVHSGKINRNAKVFVFICIGETDIKIYKRNQNLSETIDGNESYRDIVKNISKIGKKKDAEIIVLANEDSDLKIVKKIAKGWKIKAPIATYSKPENIKNLCVLHRLDAALSPTASYNVVIADCFGNEGPDTGAIAITHDSSEILERVDRQLKEINK